MIVVEIERNRIWDEATYQVAMMPIALFHDVYRRRPDQREELAAIYGEELVERAIDGGT